MTQNTLVTDAKIKWLADKGYVIVKTEGGNVSYFLTEQGKIFLNDKKD